MHPPTRDGRATTRSTVRLQRLLRQQESLRAVVESIGGELELRPLLTRILRRACRLIGATDGTIGLVDEQRNLVRTEAAYRMPADELGAEMPPGVGVAGQVLLTRRPVLLQRYGDLPAPTQLGMLENAVLGVPISWRGRMIGFFGLGIAAAPPGSTPPAAGRRKSRFTRRDVQALAVFARHAAVTIENARRYEWERRRTERLALIARVGRIVTADLRLDDMLQSAADTVHDLLGYPNVGIGLVYPDDPTALVISTFGGHYKYVIRGHHRIPISEGLMGAAVRTRRTVLVNDVLADPRYLRTPHVENPRAELAVPILIGDRALGVLNVESDQELTEDDAAGLGVVADQLAVAIENARLYATAHQVAVLEERQRLARDLHDSVTQLLFSMTLISQSLAPAWRRDPVEGERRTERLLELSRLALAEMRALVAESRGRSFAVAVADGGAAAGIDRLRSDGLVAALRDHVTTLGGDGPGVVLHVDGYAAQPPACEEALFRITQEALNNVVKHAHARRVDVRLHTTALATRLTVEDDGDGFAPGSTRLRRTRPARDAGASGGVGLASMRERAVECGGELRIVTAPGQGTAVHATIPAPRAPAR